MVKLKRNRPGGGSSGSGGAKRGGGGIGRGMNDPNQMMAQMQKLQEEMEKTQASLDDEEVTASVGGGVVTVVATANQAIKSVTIDPEAVDPEDVDMLQDLIVTAVNEALQQGKALAEDDEAGCRQHIFHPRIAGLHEGGDLADGYRNVLVQRVAIGAFRQRDRLAHHPHGPRLCDAFGDDSILDQILFERAFQRGFQRLARHGLVGEGNLHQDAPFEV